MFMMYSKKDHIILVCLTVIVYLSFFFIFISSHARYFCNNIITVQELSGTGQISNTTGDQSSTYGSLPAQGPQPDLLAAPPTCTISAHPSDGICDSWKKIGTIGDGGKYGLEIPYGSNGAI